MNRKLTDVEVITKLSDTNSILANAGGKVAQIPLADFRKTLNDNDSQVLNDLAFFMDINEAAESSTDASYRVNVGGSMTMRSLWENSWESIMMDEKGNFFKMNPTDGRYTADGDLVMDGDKLNTHYDHLDMMGVIPETYLRVQEVVHGDKRIHRVWLSLVPLPGGVLIPRQVVGKFKGCVDDQGRYRSIPGVVPTGNLKIDGFWNAAQKRSKNHGLSGLYFRNHLLFHMMAKYAWRSCQTCKTADGTEVWGVGLDGTESGPDYSNNGFTNQSQIVTGKTLILGNTDGKVVVMDKNSKPCHSVNVNIFENPWGQYWEMIQGLCSVGTDVFFWNGNFVPPTSTPPTAATFEHVDHVKLKRSTVANVTGMNIIPKGPGQGVYMIPCEGKSGVSYGDYFSYNADGQLWLFGGYSNSGSRCGLAASLSNFVWSFSASYSASRLAFFGPLNEVASHQLKK